MGSFQTIHSIYLQVRIANVATEDTCFNESFIRQLNPEAAWDVQLLLQTENQVDDEHNADSQPGDTNTNGRLRSEKINSNPLGGRDVDGDVNVEFRILEAKLQGRVEEILPDFDSHYTLTTAFDASDCQVDISTVAIPTSR